MGLFRSHADWAQFIAQFMLPITLSLPVPLSLLYRYTFNLCQFHSIAFCLFLCLFMCFTLYNDILLACVLSIIIDTLA